MASPEDGDGNNYITYNYGTVVKYSLLIFTLSSLPKLLDAQRGFKGIPGDYCRHRRPETCCPDRIDECSVPIFDTLCYCDMFCDRSDGGDCCPDFESVCRGIPQEVKGACSYQNVMYGTSERVKQNCNFCTCTAQGWNCETRHACLIQEEIIDGVNKGSYGWQASNYSDFWGETLDDGIKFRLGTIYPEKLVENMNPILIEKKDVPVSFDSRQKWPGLVHEPRDQGNCGASWAFSTTAMVADRLSILTAGKFRFGNGLSPQQLLSCNQERQRGCDGGYLDRAWWYIKKFGNVNEDCYPYISGSTNDAEKCLTPRSTHADKVLECPSGSRENKRYRITPPYRISNKEEDIKTEIVTNGPVQAILKVHEDFFMYESGVYKHTDLARYGGTAKSGYHSVRIIGYGEERGQKYWLCANSWGLRWGDRGYFKIARGENHCEIESFVLAAWGKEGKKRRRRGRRRRFRKVRKLLRQRRL